MTSPSSLTLHAMIRLRVAALRERIGLRVAEGLARITAGIVSRFRYVVQLRLTDGECEALGLDYDSTNDAASVWPVIGMPWWRVDLWIDRDPREHHLCFDLLGCHAEVSYLTRAEAADGL